MAEWPYMKFVAALWKWASAHSAARRRRKDGQTAPIPARRERILEDSVFPRSELRARW